MALLKQHSVYTGDRDGSRVVNYGWHFCAPARALWLAGCWQRCGPGRAAACDKLPVSSSGPLLLALHSQTANPHVPKARFERADITAKCLSTSSSCSDWPWLPSRSTSFRKSSHFENPALAICHALLLPLLHLIVKSYLGSWKGELFSFTDLLYCPK